MRLSLRALALLTGLALLARCAVEAPVSTRVHLRFDKDSRRVEITTATELKRDFEAGGATSRMAAERDAILAGRDQWSNRYVVIDAESERSTQEKEFGELRRVERSAVAGREQLPRFFADTPLTFQLTAGDGWNELSIFAGSGSRATREQKSNVDHMLTVWSEDGARYLAAVGKLYEYLDRRPDRSEAVFAVLLLDEERPPDNKDEEALLDEVRTSIKQIVDRADASRQNTTTIDEDFDAVFNPFPAAMTVQTPGAIEAVENFARLGDDSVEVPHAGITDALRALEGRWVAPDPLAILFRSLPGTGEPPSPRAIAAMKRKRTAAVTPAELRDALTATLQRSKVYRVRWR